MNWIAFYICRLGWRCFGNAIGRSCSAKGTTYTFHIFFFCCKNQIFDLLIITTKRIIWSFWFDDFSVHLIMLMVLVDFLHGAFSLTQLWFLRLKFFVHSKFLNTVFTSKIVTTLTQQWLYLWVFMDSVCWFGIFCIVSEGWKLNVGF